MRSHTDTLVSAMMILSRDIHCEDGVATAAIAEAGTRLLEQRDEIARLRLTNAEREAIAAAANHADWCDKEIDGVRFEASAVLRGLLARLGGDA